MEGLTRNSVLTITIVVEATLLLVAAIWIIVGHVLLGPKFQFSQMAINSGLAVAAITSIVSFFMFLLSKKISIFGELKKMNDEVLAPMLALLNPLDIVFLSLISGFCEEVFFRGLLQAQIGLVATSILFGLFHDPAFKQKSYVILAMLAGLVFGYLYQQTDSLWAPIVAHSTHNLIAMIGIRYFSKDEKKDSPE